MDNNTKTITISEWPFRIKLAVNPNKPLKVILLLHGHLGNEDSMWVLTKPLPDCYTLLAPRAPVETGERSYSWHEINDNWPAFSHYQELANQLLSRVDKWSNDNLYQVDSMDVMGFSQGAVMAYALAMSNPEKIRKVAALAGFIPSSWHERLNQSSLSDKDFFIAHGIHDEMVPFEKARQAENWLRENHARVTFCEADTGHKLTANCLRGLGEFFSNDR